MRRRNSFGRSVFLMLLVLGLTTSAQAFNPQPDPPGFGMIGIVRGQTARLNVVIDNPNIIDNPDILVALTFVDDMGNVLAESRVSLTPGQAQHLEYSSAFGTLLREQIRAIVRFIDDPNIRIRAPRILGTLEVFDTESGHTAFILPGTERFIKEVDPAPAPATPGR